MVDKKTQSALRKEVYDFISQDLKIEKLTDAQYDKLRNILKSVYENRTRETMPDMKPLVHKVLCPDCGNYKLLVGKRKYSNYKKSLPKDVKETIQHEEG